MLLTSSLQQQRKPVLQETCSSLQVLPPPPCCQTEPSEAYRGSTQVHVHVYMYQYSQEKKLIMTHENVPISVCRERQSGYNATTGISQEVQCGYKCPPVGIILVDCTVTLCYLYSSRCLCLLCRLLLNVWF